ncbi:MAG: hypothetical protein ACQERS_14235, partial [Bacteroidota bacterium]
KKEKVQRKKEKVQRKKEKVQRKKEKVQRKKEKVGAKSGSAFVPMTRYFGGHSKARGIGLNNNRI